ncbi:MAG: AAA-like domain-containing protein [Cyanobacteria bacterium P01_C01_bin.72]
MFSFSQKTKRKRGVILSPRGWQRLSSAQQACEHQRNGGVPYTLEELNEMTGLSSHTLTKVRRHQYPVDRQTLECYFNAFDLALNEKDYTKPLPEVKIGANGKGNPDYQDIDQLTEPSLPEGQVSLDSPFYIERSSVEARCFKTVMQPGSLIRIKASRRMGKSSLMVRILNHATQQGCKTVFLSLNLAERRILQDLDKFLQWFSASVCLGLQLPNRIDGFWDELFGSKISCKIYFEQYLLSKTIQPVVLALDDVDRLFDYPELADEFFGLLRTWHEQAKNRGIWQQLRLIVAHSTEVYIPLNVNKSPFNVGVPVNLGAFSTQQVKNLAQQYLLDLSSADIANLIEIGAGQPYLTQLALYSLWQDQISPDELLAEAVADKGIYSNHLQRLLWTLRKDPALATALAQVVHSSSPVVLDLLQGFKLESLGLVKLQGNQAISSCALYTSYFGDRLK